MSVGTVSKTRPARAATRSTAAPPDAVADPQDVSKVGHKRTTDIFQRLKRYAPSVLPFGVGAAVTLKYGIDELHEGNRHDGLVDVARGAGGILDDANLLIYANGFGLAHIAGPILTAAGLVGAVSMFATAPLDGGRDLIHGIHDHNGKLAAIGGVKLAACGLGIAGSLTHLPVFLVAGTAVGLGALVYQNWSAIEKMPGKAKHLAQELPDMAEQLAHRVHDRLLHHGQQDATSEIASTATGT